MTTRRLFEIILLLALFTIAVRETVDPDMWWHLKTGQVIVEDGLPRQDIYSYTSPDNTWVTHEWLSEVVMWLVFSRTQFAGLIILFAVLTTLAYWLVYLRSQGRPYLAAFIVLTAALASAPFWGARPQVFNILFTASFVFLVEGYRDGRVSRRTLWLLPLLTIIWANLHSGYLLGIALLVAYVAGEGLQRLIAPHHSRLLEFREFRHLGMITLFCFLAAALNPNGPSLWIYPFFTLGSQAMQRYILEWHSPDFHQPIFWPFALMLATGIGGLLASRHRISWTDLILFGGTAGAGLFSARHIPLFAIVATPIIARYWMYALDGTALGRFLENRSPTGDTGRVLVLINWTILLVIVLASGVWIASIIQNNEKAIAQRFPVDAVDFIKREELDNQRIYNHYNWGGYLIWRDVPVFVDGRADVYGDDFLLDYRRTFDVTEAWDELLDTYRVDYLLIARSSALNNLMQESPNWQQRYIDRLATIYVRAEE